MVVCERCEEEVEFLTKTTGTCPKCARGELEMGQWTEDQEDSPELAGNIAKSNVMLERSLQKEGINMEDD